MTIFKAEVEGEMSINLLWNLSEFIPLATSSPLSAGPTTWVCEMDPKPGINKHKSWYTCTALCGRSVWYFMKVQTILLMSKILLLMIDNAAIMSPKK